MSVLALSGGIGGAKLALGLYRTLPPRALTIVANTGDDFEHLGLSVSPDIDTLLYTLAGIDNPETGWGRKNETWTFMAALEAVGGETWFKLGDGDLATHIERTRRLAGGERLSQVTDHFRRRFGISASCHDQTLVRSATSAPTSMTSACQESDGLKTKLRRAVPEMPRCPRDRGSPLLEEESLFCSTRHQLRIRDRPCHRAHEE